MTTTTRPVIGLDTSSFGYHWASNVPMLGYLYTRGGSTPGQSAGDYVGWFKARGSVEERWPSIYEEGVAFFGGLPDGTYIFCEEPLALPRNGKTTRVLGISAGVIYGAMCAAAVDTDLTWFWVDVASWKRAVLGNGSAKKDLIRSTVRDNPTWQELAGRYRSGTFEGVRQIDTAKYDDLFEDQPDLYDAWSLMRYGVQEVVGG